MTKRDAAIRLDERVNILLVDDQPSRLLTYEVILGDLGQKLVKAGSGAEALALLMKSEFAVILLDVSMPGMDGFETAALIHEHPRFANTPIIFVTAFHVTDLDRMKGYGLGAVDYVYVPVVPEILRGKVAVLVELYRHRRTLEALNRRLEQANKELASANSTLQAEKTRELKRLNRNLERANGELARANETLKAEVAERGRLEEALRETDRRKDEFLATLAHELRNPLAPILNAVQVIKMKSPQDAELLWCHDVIEGQASQLSRLVDDLLDVARITQGKFKLRTEPIDLAAVVARGVQTSRPAIDAAGQTLVVETPSEPVAMVVDPTRIAQVVSNLLNNAAKYGAGGGRVRLSAAVETSEGGRRREAVIRVADTGIGIPAETLPKIFEPFMQADASVARSQGGLGIGLALVKRIVELHGGTVEAKSAGPGHGSEFAVRLPMDAERRPDERDAPLPAVSYADVRPLRILVVDDNPASAKTMTMLLKKMGHELATAYDGEGAVETAAEFRPDLALLDIGLPKLDGYEVARRIRSRPDGRSITLVALTGWGQEEDRRKSKEAGFDHHLTKPVGHETLVRVLADAAHEVEHAASPSSRDGG
jgi:signal transduction histidine kinase